MNKKLKRMAVVGATVLMTASSVGFSNAMQVKKSCDLNLTGKMYVCINGKRFKLDLSCASIFDTLKWFNKNNCPNKFPSIDNNKDDNDNIEDNNQNDDNNSSNINGFSKEQVEVLNLVNKERKANGLKPLTLNKELSNVANIKSRDMIEKGYFDHTSPTYGSPFDMMKKFNISYNTAGENIAMGQKTPSEVMNSWMNSSGHRANILNSTYTELGVGIQKDSNGTIYWTQMFIGR